MFNGLFTHRFSIVDMVGICIAVINAFSGNIINSIIVLGCTMFLHYIASRILSCIVSIIAGKFEYLAIGLCLAEGLGILEELRDNR